MKNFKLSLVDREVLEDRLKDKYKKIDDLKVESVNVFQQEYVNNTLITIIIFSYGFFEINFIEFGYYNDELFVVSGDKVTMKFIDEMKNLLKEYKK